MQVNKTKATREISNIMDATNTKKKLAYICDEKLIEECNRLPTMQNRASIVQDLINSYGLLNLPKITVYKSSPASEEDLKLFHATSYIDFMKRTNDCDYDELEEFEDEQEEFGLGYDCPLLERNFDFISTIAGGSITATKLLLDCDYQVVVNWFGGWHHAQRDEAEGFCYVNDIVISIHKLTEKFDRILYVDLDVHHGNGVQNAFEMSKKILTLSFHKCSPGFYPGSGSLDDIGMRKGRYYSLNVPFLEGVSDNTYLSVFHQIFPKVYEAFSPSAIVVQCGADILKGDPIGGCNITLKTMGVCFRSILDKGLPTLVLGGGGYHFANTAKYWTYLLSLLLEETIPSDIPDTCKYFTEYGPTYELNIDAGNMKDCNTEEYIKSLVDKIFSYCLCIRETD